MRPVELLLSVWACVGIGVAQGEIVRGPFGDVEMVHGSLPADVRDVLWVAYGKEAVVSPEEQQYLGDLQRRFADRGFAVVVLMPMVAELVEQAPPFAVAARGYVLTDSPHVALARGPELERLAKWRGSIDGSVDVLHSIYADQFDGPAMQLALDEHLGAWLKSVGDGDGGGAAEEVARLARLLPRSGRARALQVLYEWWCRGDLAKGRTFAEQALRDLATEYVPLTLFADLVLRGGQNQPDLARLVAGSLAPAVAVAPEGAFTQLVYLRALLLAGQDRLAGRYAATLPKLVKGNPKFELLLVETLMEADQPAVFRDVAERLLAACKGKVDARWWDATRYKVMVGTGASQAELDAFLAAYHQTAGHRNHGLNNDAWYIMVEPSTMGRFDDLALANVRKMQEEEGEEMSTGNKDTVALALYRNGLLAEAVGLQREAAKADGTATYRRRLARFQAELKSQRETKNEGRPPR